MEKVTRPMRASPVMSPDGSTVTGLDEGDDTTIADGRDWCSPGDPRLILIDTATGAPRAVDGTPQILERPSFSPDGQQLAALSPTDGTGGPGSSGSVVVGRADGTQMRTVAITGTEDEDLVWTPDGSALVVAGARVAPACGDLDDPDDAEGDVAGSGCDVFTATSDVRIVEADGVEL